MKINWKVRIKNKAFWLAIIPAVLVLIQVIAAVFGVHFDFSDLQGKLLAVVDAVFVLLAILGIVTDHTTKGVSDSGRALSYESPYEEEFTREDTDRSDNAPIMEGGDEDGEV